MKLTKEQILAFYLPFGLKYISVNENGGDLDYKGKIRKPIHISFDEDLCNSKLWKPLLRPLSSLTIEQEINGERVVPIERLESFYAGYNYFALIGMDSRNIDNVLNPVLSDINQLLSMHFNVFNLPEDEYVDINNLKK